MGMGARPGGGQSGETGEGGGRESAAQEEEEGEAEGGAEDENIRGWI